MKQLLSLLASVIVTACAFGQAPDKMSYQSVIRNSAGALVTNAGVSMKISILQGSATGTPVYVEEQGMSTNANGLASLQIGNGFVLTGALWNIDWANGPYFLKTETDPAGGSNYTISGTTQLLSVPYAMYAEHTKEWHPIPNGIGHDGNVGINTNTVHPYVPLTVYATNVNNQGNASLHLKSIDTWHTALSIFNGPESNQQHYSLILAGPSNNSIIPGSFGLFNHISNSWSYNFNPTTNNMAVGSTSFNANDAKSKLHVFNGDVNIDEIGSGVITKSPNGNCWRITVSDSGALVTTAIACPQ